MIKRRRKDTTAAARGNGKRGGENLAEAEHDHDPERQLAIDGMLNPAVAARHQVRKPDRERSQHQSADGRFDEIRNRQWPEDAIPHAVEDKHVDVADDGAEYGENQVEGNLGRTTKLQSGGRLESQARTVNLCEHRIGGNGRDEARNHRRCFQGR